MIVKCDKCSSRFEDEYRSTICPHGTFPVNDGNNVFAVHEGAYLEAVDGSVYDESYFLRGRETGKSLYENYRWMPSLTTRMVQAIVEHLDICRGDRILDFGCARGYVVKVLRRMGYDAYGVDISEWAIRNADGEVRPYVNLSVNGPSLLPREFDWVIAKDVLEHVPNCAATVNYLMDAARIGVFAVVPLSAEDDAPYVVPEYELDVTHLHRLTLPTWAQLFTQPGWECDAVNRVVGVKDNYWKPGWEDANGFITARRVESK